MQMKKLSLLLLIALSVLVGSVPAWAASAPAKSNSVYWLEEYDSDWAGINVSVIDGKKNASKRLFKGGARSMAVVGDWIYFLKLDPSEEIVIGDIFKMKKDGSKLTQVTKGNNVGQFDVDGQSIYYSAYDQQSNYKLYVMNLDGTGSKPLKAKLPSWSYAVGKGGTIFYVNADKNDLLYRMKPDGTGAAAVSSKPVSPGAYKRIGDILFYSTYLAEDDTIKSYLVDQNGKNNVALDTKNSIVPVAYTNGWFYYQDNVSKNGVESSVIMKVKRDGKQKQTVAALGEGDRYLEQLENSFVFMTSSGKVYQIGLDGKVKKPSGN